MRSSSGLNAYCLAKVVFQYLLVLLSVRVGNTSELSESAILSFVAEEIPAGERAVSQ